MRIFIAPYQMYSESAKVLAQSLGSLRVDATKRFKNNDLIVNWGNTDISNTKGNPIILNAKTGLAKNKLSTLQTLSSKGISTLTYTTDAALARAWIDVGETVYGRRVLTGHSGEGIFIMNKENGSFMECPLYTLGIIKAHEYRVHVFNNKVIDIQKKRRKGDMESSDYIKNVSNGWVFCRENVKAPLELYNECIKAVNSLGLNFGAVDVLYKESENRIAILEVNTAPGLEGTTLEKYKEAIQSVATKYR